MKDGHVRATAFGLLAAIATAIVIGVPSDVIPNPWFTREIGVDALDVVVLVALSLLTGALAATYALAGGKTVAAERSGFASAAIGYFAISCPVCNKIVVALAGTAGASGWFASVQPILGVGAVALAAAALIVRVRAMRSGACAAPAARTSERARA